MSSIGTLTLHRTPSDHEASVAASFSFAARHEIVAGQTLTGTPTLRVFLNGALSTDLTVASIALDSTKTLVNFLLTDATAVVGNTYVLSCAVVLSGGATLVETIDVLVDGIG